MFVFQLAEHLHKTKSEIQNLPYKELIEWRAYFLLKEENKQ